MGKSKKSVQIVILLAIILIGVYAVATVVFGSDEVPKVGQKAADFELLGMDGNVHTMSEYEGKARVINFWGTYCPPCVRKCRHFKPSGKNGAARALRLSESMWARTK